MTTQTLASAATQHAKSWIEPLARMGYTARGVIYLLIGGLALPLLWTRLRAGRRRRSSSPT